MEINAMTDTLPALPTIDAVRAALPVELDDNDGIDLADGKRAAVLWFLTKAFGGDPRIWRNVGVYDVDIAAMQRERDWTADQATALYAAYHLNRGIEISSLFGVAAALTDTDFAALLTAIAIHRAELRGHWPMTDDAGRR
jgi:hypothetical protein